jgi:hypothetical protein
MTLEGPPQVGTLNPYDTTQAETICWESGVKTQECSEGGMIVDSIHNGDYIKVKGVNFGAGADTFIARVASATTGGNIELRLDTTTGTIVGTCAVAGTGGWQTWTTRTNTVTGATGVHDLYLRFTGGSGLLFNFNWWKFTPLNSALGMTGKNRADRGNTIKVTPVEKSGTLRVDFSRPLSTGEIKVCLFDLTGRLVSTVFAGNVSSWNLKLPLTQVKILPGAYCLKIVSNNTVVMMKIITLK